MRFKLSESNYIYYVYRNLTCLGMLLHIIYSILTGYMHDQIPLLYNICSVLFYIGMLLLVTQKKRYALAVSLIHLETICFVVLHTVMFGWHSAFFLFLIGMASLVYFCPYRNPHIPYLFSILHMIAFFLLHTLMQDRAPCILSTASIHTLFLFNSAGAFLIILYVAYVSNASADIGKKALKKQNEDLLQIANYDSLTGLYNRSGLKKTAAVVQLEHSCLAIGDIDDFKLINDTYGHICGDAVLKQLAEHMRSRLDPDICICRWGGEEFVFLFHDTQLQDALQQLTAFCQWLNSTVFFYEQHEINVTMTFGICQGQPDLALNNLIDRADHLLYRGKQEGKKMVVSEAVE